MKERVLIIGGGPAALATAFELTADGGEAQYDVTVLQPGWRLGGKCASGRNTGLHQRIEEHGLHVWFGCYDNAFDLMERCFEELRWSEEHAFRSVPDAFEGIDTIVLGQRREGRWDFKEVTFPRNRVPPLNFVTFAVEALGWAGRRLIDLQAPDALERPAEEVIGGPAPGPPTQDFPWGSWLAHAVSRLQRRAARMLANVTESGADDLLDVLDGFAAVVDQALPDSVRRDPDYVYFRETVDLLLATLRGVWEDQVLQTGFDALNSWELADWLRRHGAELAEDPIEWPAMLRAVYDGCFAFSEGDPNQPRIAAGRALQGVVRCIFHYRGSVVFRMRAGMGDTVIAPLYEVLKRRGVEFRFFHAAQELIPSEDGTRIEEVRAVRQVDVEGFEPLIEVPFGEDGKVVWCWPSEPPDGVLGPKAKGQSARLEFEINPFKGRELPPLRAGTDFDHVVLAVPPDVQKQICKRLAAASSRYGRMLAESHTVVTQAMQLWLSRSSQQLGQTFTSDSIMSGYVEPINTYCDMAHLIAAEPWQEGDVRHIGYFCGVLPHAGLDTQADADAAAGTGSEALLENDMAVPWPGVARPASSAAREAPSGFSWDSLVPPVESRRTGGAPARLSTQYVRANWAPTERYVLSLPGTIEHRLRPDESGFENMVLAGDWTVSGFDAGCVEAAVTSGKLAAAAIRPELKGKPIAGLDGPASFPNRIAAEGPPSGAPAQAGLRTWIERARRTSWAGLSGLLRAGRDALARVRSRWG